MMRFEGFKRAVKKLAKGRYHSVAYRIIEHYDGEVIHEWTAYIANMGWTRDHATPELALRELKEMSADLG